MHKFIIATQNEDKLLELKRMLIPLGIEPLSLSEAGVDFGGVEETGETFAQNARIKARAAFERSGMPAIGDDSGLCVDALDGAPGVYSARYAGEGASNADRIQKLLTALDGVPVQERTARFVCAVCCILSGGQEIAVQGVFEGRIGFEPKGGNGFGYDPVFLLPDGRSAAEITDDEKDRISHRSRALSKLQQALGSIFKAGKEAVLCSPHKNTMLGSSGTMEGIRMLTSKQRAALRALANPLETIFQIGKGGITPALIAQIDDVLRVRELIKVRVLETSPIPAKEAAGKLAGETSAEVVQVIGHRFVLFRRNEEDPKIEI